MRRALPALASAALAAVLVGIAPALADAACPAESQGFQLLKAGDAEVAFRWEPAELRVGRFFAAEVVACRAPGLGTVEEIAIDATMPAHGHGMNYRPAVERTAAGRYRFTGLMLHMPGTWRVTFDLLQGGKRTRLTHEVNLKR
jgi:hypothetical protein